MRKTILYIAASIDNYIAKADGGLDWLHDPDYVLKGEDYGYNAFVASIDATLMGNATYQAMLDMGVPFTESEQKTYVFSRSRKKEENQFVEFVSSDIAAFTRQLKEQPGKDIWLMGGGQINTVLLENGLIDQIILTIIPITLGDGIPLFQKGAVETKFDLEKCQAFKGGLVQLIFNKK